MNNLGPDGRRHADHRGERRVVVHRARPSCRKGDRRISPSPMASSGVPTRRRSMSPIPRSRSFMPMISTSAGGPCSNPRVFSAIKDLGYPDGAADRQRRLSVERALGGPLRGTPRARWHRRPHRSDPRLTGHLLRFRRTRSQDALCDDRAPGETAEEAARFPQQGGLFAFEAPVAGLARPRFAG